MPLELPSATEINQLFTKVMNRLDSIEEKIDRTLSPDAYVPASTAKRFSGHDSNQGFIAWAERKGIDYKYLNPEPGKMEKPKRVWNRLQVIQNSKLPDYKLKDLMMNL